MRGWSGGGAARAALLLAALLAWGASARAAQLAIVGPATRYWGEPGQYALAHGPDVNGVSARWTVARLPVLGPADSLVDFAAGETLTYADTMSFALTVRATDTTGALAIAQQYVLVKAASLQVAGSASRVPGQPDTFTVVRDSTLGAAPPSWYVQPWCGTLHCGDPVLADTGWTFVHADTSDYDVIATTTSAWGQPLASRSFVWVSPVAAINGPDALYSGQSGTFRFVPGSTAPGVSAVWWVSHWVGGVQVDSVRVGTGLSLTWHDKRPFRVTAFELSARTTTPVYAASQLVAMRPFQVVLSGPTHLQAMETGWYTVALDAAIDTTTILWRFTRDCPGACGGPWLDQTFTRSFAIGDSLNLHIYVTANSRWGEADSAAIDVTIGTRTMSANGPTALASGAVGTFAVSQSNGFTPYPPTWYAQRQCCDGSCGPALKRLTGWTFTYADSADFIVVATGTNDWYMTVRDTVRVAVSGALSTRLRGPRYSHGAIDTLRYAVTAVGNPPYLYSWYTSNLDGSNRQRVGQGATLSLSAASSLTLEADASDCAGHRGVAVQELRVPALAIAGPAEVDADSTVTFACATDAPYADLTRRWSVRPHCAAAGCDTTWTVLGTGERFTRATRTDYDLQLTLADTSGFSIATRTSVAVRAPRAHIVSAGLVGGTGRAYKSQVTGAGPMKFAWRLLPAGEGEAPTALGSGPSVVVSVPPPYRLELAITDVNFRTAADTLVEGELPSPAAPRGVALSCAGTTADGLVVRLWGPAAEEAHLRVYDVGGRAVVESFTGPYAGGAHTLTLQTRDLAQGNYFLSWEVSGRRAVRRFVVLR